MQQLINIRNTTHGMLPMPLFSLYTVDQKWTGFEGLYFMYTMTQKGILRIKLSSFLCLQ